MHSIIVTTGRCREIRASLLGTRPGERPLRGVRARHAGISRQRGAWFNLRVTYETYPMVRNSLSVYEPAANSGRARVQTPSELASSSGAMPRVPRGLGPNSARPGGVLGASSARARSVLAVVSCEYTPSSPEYAPSSLRVRSENTREPCENHPDKGGNSTRARELCLSPSAPLVSLASPHGCSIGSVGGSRHPYPPLLRIRA